MSPPPRRARWRSSRRARIHGSEIAAHQRRGAVDREQEADLEPVEPEPRGRDGPEIREAAPQEDALEADDPVEDARRTPPQDEAVVGAAARSVRGRRLVDPEENGRGREREAADGDVQDPPRHEVGDRAPDRRREALGHRPDRREPSDGGLTLAVRHGLADVGEGERDHGGGEDPSHEPRAAEQEGVRGLARQERAHPEAERRHPDDADGAVPIPQGSVEELAEAVRQHVEGHGQADAGDAGPERLRDRREERRHHPHVHFDEERDGGEERKGGEPSRRPADAEAHPATKGWGAGPPVREAVAPSTGRVRTPSIRQLPCSSTSS